MLKKLFLLSLFGIIISFIINCVYVKYFHPESVFFSECIEKSKEWENHIRKKDEPCYIFAGGSEVRMSIDPEVMWNSHQIRAINAGIQAGNGILCNLQSAWPFLQPNDYLVVSLCRFNYVPPCMGQHIVIRCTAVVSTADDLPVPDDDTADGNFT